MPNAAAGTRELLMTTQRMCPLPANAKPDEDPGLTEGTGLHKQDMFHVQVAHLNVSGVRSCPRARNFSHLHGEKSEMQKKQMLQTPRIILEGKSECFPHFSLVPCSSNWG